MQLLNIFNYAQTIVAL